MRKELKLRRAALFLEKKPKLFAYDDEVNMLTLCLLFISVSFLGCVFTIYNIAFINRKEKEFLTFEINF